MLRKVGLGEARDTTLTGGGRSQVVSKFLQGGGAGYSIVCFINVGPFGVNGKEDRGDSHGGYENDHRKESKYIRRWDMGDSGGRRHMRGSRKPVGLDYIERRQATVAQWVALCPLFEVCTMEIGN